MSVILAAICFGLSFVLGGLQVHTNAWFTPLNLIALGGFFGVLAVAGFGREIPRR